MALPRRVGIGLIVAAFAGTAFPAVSTATMVKKHKVLCASKRASECATLVVHVYGNGGPNGKRVRLESQKVNIVQLRAGGKGSSVIVTREHRVHVIPGRYKVSLGGPFERKVILHAGQTREITLEIGIK